MTLSSEVFSNRLFEEMTAGIAIFNKAFQAIRVNASCATMLGTTPEAILAAPADEVEELARLMEHFRAIQNEEVEGEVAKILTFGRVGEDVRRVQVRVWSTEDEGDEVQFCVVFDDRTELEELLAHTQYSERGFREVIEYAPDGIAIHRDGRFLYINPAFVEKLGVSHSDDLLDRDVYDFVHPDERLALKKRMRGILATGEQLPLRETILLRADGSEWIADLTGRVVFFGGEPAVATLARDITEQKRMAARMMQMDRMIAAGTLASGVGHEINNPLSYISTNLDFSVRRLEHVQKKLVSGDKDLDMTDLQAQLTVIQDALEDAIHGSSRIGDIVRKLGMFASDGDEQFQAISIGPLIDSVIGMVASGFESVVEVLTKGEGPFVIKGVYERITRLFFNILLNAHHSGDENVGIHKVRVEIAKSGGNVIVEVYDTGSGISKELLTQIFDPFFTTKPVGKGTGLGLYICQQIVEAHEGRIEVESSAGEGSVFRVFLPVGE